MRTALCFCGVVGGTTGKGGTGESLPVLNMGYRFYREFILEENDVDVFVHTWTTELEDEIKELYFPRSIIAEPQITFNKNPKRKFRINNHLSRWYSTKKTIELKKAYEEEHDIKYDCVMVTRFDISFHVPVIFAEYDMSKFYVSHWDKIMSNGKHIPNKYMHIKKYHNIKHIPIGYPHDYQGLLDLWFFSNSENMDKFSTLYDNMKEYMEECPKDATNSISSHQLSLYHLKKIGLDNDIEFTMHYGLEDKEDYSLVRRKYFGARK